MTPEQAKYSLIGSQVIPQLRDRDFFRGSITYNFNFLAARFGCQTLMSKSRLGDVHDFWLVDVARTLKDGMPERTIDLDHFKHAAFIAFWLRRMQPINETKVIAGWDIDPSPERYKRRKRFLRYGAEYCALIIGYQICLNYELKKIFPQYDDISPTHGTRLEYLGRTQFPDALISDFVMVLKHKNMSPYGLYLLYKALFLAQTLATVADLAT